MRNVHLFIYFMFLVIKPAVLLIWNNRVLRVQGYRKYSFEFCVPYVLIVEPTTNSLVSRFDRFIFIFKMKVYI